MRKSHWPKAISNTAAPDGDGFGHRPKRDGAMQPGALPQATVTLAFGQTCCGHHASAGIPRGIHPHRIHPRHIHPRRIHPCLARAAWHPSQVAYVVPARDLADGPDHQRSLGHRPRLSTRESHWPKANPNEAAPDGDEFGRRPKRDGTMQPGASPQATVTLAFGQTCLRAFRVAGITRRRAFRAASIRVAGVPRGTHPRSRTWASARSGRRPDHQRSLGQSPQVVDTRITLAEGQSQRGRPGWR